MNSKEICIACGEAALTPFGKRKEYDYYLCEKCGSIQLFPIPDEQELREAYTLHYSKAGHYQEDPEERNANASEVFRSMLKALSAYVPRAPKVLDYGCGWGGMLKCLKQAGIVGEGADLSIEMTGYCRKAGFTVHQKNLQELSGVAVYDVILMTAVFEHFPDPESTVSDIGRLLTPGGYFITLQPAGIFARFWGELLRFGIRKRPLPQLHEVYCPPWHIVLYSVEGMRRLMARHGFRLLEVRNSPLQKGKGIVGGIRRMINTMNALGWRLFGSIWPFTVCHIMVFQKDPAVKNAT